MITLDIVQGSYSANIVPNDSEGYGWVLPTVDWKTTTFKFRPKLNVDSVSLYFKGANPSINKFDIDNISIEVI